MRIKIITDPNITNVSVSNEFASRGDNITFICTAEGEDINLQWVFNGINLTENVDTTATSITLRVFDIEESNGGEYICLTENASGNESQSVTLYISPYTVTVPAVNILTSVFENVTYTCDAEGFPPPNITWWKISNEGEDSETSVMVSDTGLLIFTSVVYSDFGTYRCLISAFTTEGVELVSPTPPTSILTG